MPCGDVFSSTERDFVGACSLQEGKRFDVSSHAKERVMIRDALTDSFQLPVYFDYPATFIWALSGALLAARLRMDPTGVAIIVLVTAAGGGTAARWACSPGRP